MKYIVTKGATDWTANLFAQNSASTLGAGLTGLTAGSAGLTAYYVRVRSAPVALTLNALSSITASHSDGGFIEIDATNMPGWYRLDFPDAVFASAAGIHHAGAHLKGATNLAPLPLEFELSGVDLQDTVRGGMTALPNAAAEAAGGLYTRGTGAGQINQAVNGQIDANVVALSGDATAADNAEAAFDGGTFNVGGGSIVAASVTGAVGSVTGAVGSVTGAVGSVTGAVGSVTGAVGSVTGNVGGNVTGSVGSIAAGGIAAASFAAGAINNTAIAADAIGASELAADAVAEIAAGVLGAEVITGYDVQESLKVGLASDAGKTSGMGTTTGTIRNVIDSADTVVATIDADGNRTAVTVTP